MVPVVVAALLAACGERRPVEGTAPAPAAATAAVIEHVPPVPGLKLRPLTDRVFEPGAARRERGRYLAEGILQCAICHSDRDWNQPGAPPVAGKAFAGHVWRDDGETRLVAPNLTPDAATGIGRWSDDMLARAIREGISHDGRPLHPQMWYPSFSQLSDEDLASVVVFLRSLAPIRNPLPRTQLSEEQLQRFVGRPMPITTPVAGPKDDSPLERGRYLANIADCSGCHTGWEAPRLAGAYAGGNDVGRDGRTVFSSNITPHPTGMAYDEKAFIDIMRSGKNGLTHPVMPWAAFRNLTSDDLAALHVFLQSRHPVSHRVSNLAQPTMCVVCGQAHGLGSLNVLERPTGPALPAAALAEYVGTYRIERWDWTVRIVLEHGALHARSEGAPPATLVAMGKDFFLVDGGLGPMRFTRGADGVVDGLVSIDVDDTVLARIDGGGDQAGIDD